MAATSSGNLLRLPAVLVGRLPWTFGCRANDDDHRMAMMKQHITWRSIMKILAAILLTGMAVIAANPAFAGRDESQMMLVRQAMEKKKAENTAQAKQQQRGLAGATGVPGTVGPGTQPAKPKKDPSAHP